MKKSYPKRGFGSMTPEARSAIASLGGHAAQARGTAHKWTVESGKAAGRLGGLASAAKRRQVKGIV